MVKRTVLLVSIYILWAFIHLESYDVIHTQTSRPPTMPTRHCCCRGIAKEEEEEVEPFSSFVALSSTPFGFFPRFRPSYSRQCGTTAENSHKSEEAKRDVTPPITILKETIKKVGKKKFSEA